MLSVYNGPDGLSYSVPHSDVFHLLVSFHGVMWWFSVIGWTEIMSLKHLQ